ncbi:MAG: AbrB/MazE/SpoVT family DNA-binding domain-containing protein [Clostridia bacterium]|nr:AbrB/MazE/SpoVT family DNA-binding domain-containing protein [Clostridia bacterium]MBQ6707503.1 AbrB/MazE/SpoVT family DNA-binding domain-containing protein [Clostridia bacterium]
MKSLGIVRPIDNVGRIVLPKELRRLFDLVDDKDSVEIFVEGDQIILRKYTPACSICGSAEKVVDYKNHKLCSDCIDKITKMRDIQFAE